MTTLEFLSYLRSLDVKVWADGDKLRYRARESTLSPSLRMELAQRKSEILRVLNELDLSVQPKRLPLERAPRDRELPLSFAQQRLWFIEQLDPGNAVYNCPGGVKLEGPLNLEAAESAVNEI